MPSPVPTTEQHESCDSNDLSQERVCTPKSTPATGNLSSSKRKRESDEPSLLEKKSKVAIDSFSYVSIFGDKSVTGTKAELRKELQERLCQVYDCIWDELMRLEEFDCEFGLSEDGFKLDSTTCGRKDGCYSTYHDLDGSIPGNPSPVWEYCSADLDEYYGEYKGIKAAAYKLGVEVTFNASKNA